MGIWPFLAHYEQWTPRTGLYLTLTNISDKYLSHVSEPHSSSSREPTPGGQCFWARAPQFSMASAQPNSRPTWTRRDSKWPGGRSGEPRGLAPWLIPRESPVELWLHLEGPGSRRLCPWDTVHRGTGRWQVWVRDQRSSLQPSGNFLFKIKIVANHLLRAKRKTWATSSLSHWWADCWEDRTEPEPASEAQERSVSHLPVARSLGPVKGPDDPQCPQLCHETPQLPERVPGRAERVIVH